MTFVSTSTNATSVTGDLTVAGVTKPVTLDGALLSDNVAIELEIQATPAG